MSVPPPSPPLALLAELTHRCPLQCLYCYNPINLTTKETEIGTETWKRVFHEAAALGVLQLHLSGGEPLLRPDIVELVACASDHGLYSNLITSGIGLTDRLLAALDEAGVNHIQLSIQAQDAHTAKQIAGGDYTARKHEAAARIKQSGIPFSVNTVLHRLNLHEVGALIDLAAAFGAERLELANTQYYGWALKNRDALLPSQAQLTEAEAVVEAKRKQYPMLEMLWVIPDYYDTLPKACMGGWASTQLTVSPSGQALPCPGAYIMDDLDLPHVETSPLHDIWYHSEAFNIYRGFSWMKEPCLSCDRRFEDFGGCRCQALLLTGDARAADPVCHLSADHALIAEAREEAMHHMVAHTALAEHRPRTA